MPYEHYVKAEQLLDRAAEVGSAAVNRVADTGRRGTFDVEQSSAALLIAAAQVHATLAMSVVGS
jgi:hypothetical protein